MNEIKSNISEEVYFTGIRKPIKQRIEIIDRVKFLKSKLKLKSDLPFVHIIRFDTPVEGYDSETGFFLEEYQTTEPEIKTHLLRKHYFISKIHKGALSTIRETVVSLYKQLNKSGLAPELEIREIYHKFDLENPENPDNEIKINVSYLGWKEVYKEQLLKHFSKERTEQILAGGEKLTPFTDVDTRASWVGETLKRLKEQTTEEEQFAILSRVCLYRPIEDTNKYKLYYEETKSLEKVLKKHNEDLKKLRGENGGYLEEPFCNDKVLHLSKVPYLPKEYFEAKDHQEKRKAYCHCTLVREAKDPQIDPIFCYRASGWARQFWEGIMGVEFKKCKIIKSVLKGDEICSWEYELD